MIRELHLRNFKSILDARVTFGSFNVLIGANGSGKSNLVKALDFLSVLPARGVAAATSRHGGFEGILPKQIPTQQLSASRISFEYQAVLAPPSMKEEWPADHPITVDHSFTLSHTSGPDVVKVRKESLTFNQVLAVSEILESPDELPQNIGQESWFRLERGPRGAVTYRTNPPIRRKTMQFYARWLGLSFLSGLKTKKALEEILEDLTEVQQRSSNGHKRAPAATNRLFVEPQQASIAAFSPELAAFAYTLKSIRRYDLLLGQLRTEQESSDRKHLFRSGRNLPSLLRILRADASRAESWERLQDTFSAIAPHILSAASSSLRSGKEFVEFIESEAGRGVESWESSDGSLRALAILLALETHPKDGTVLIEEPEQNLHPWAVRRLIEHMRDVARRRGLQVILTTHSEQVLERVEPAEVLVAIRSAEDGTVFREINQLLPHADLTMGEVGRLWVKGLLGGVPGDV